MDGYPWQIGETMNEKKWKEYLNRMPFEYNDRGPSGIVDFSSDDIALPISPVNLNILKDCKSVVDLGCGVGRALKILKENGKMVRGITRNNNEVKDGRAKYGLTNDELIAGDLHDTPYPDNFFDGAIMWESLEHALSPIIALWECNRILKPGGRLLLFLPNKVYVDAGDHVLNLNVPQVKALLTKTSFKLCDLVDYTGDSARYVATRLSGDINIEELKNHNKTFPSRDWTDLKEFTN